MGFFKWKFGIFGKTKIEMLLIGNLGNFGVKLGIFSMETLGFWEGNLGNLGRNIWDFLSENLGFFNRNFGNF